MVSPASRFHPCFPKVSMDADVQWAGWRGSRLVLTAGAGWGGQVAFSVYLHLPPANVVVTQCGCREWIYTTVWQGSASSRHILLRPDHSNVPPIRHRKVKPHHDAVTGCRIIAQWPE
jgi:hypothetical protein